MQRMQMGETVTFVNNLKHCRRTESLCAEADDRLTSHQLYAMSPIVSSGVSSRGLFDVVVASVKGCTINAKISIRVRMKEFRVRTCVYSAGGPRPGKPPLGTGAVRQTWRWIAGVLRKTIGKGEQNGTTGVPPKP